MKTKAMMILAAAAMALGTAVLAELTNGVGERATTGSRSCPP